MKGFSKDAFRAIVKESRENKGGYLRKSFEDASFHGVAGNEMITEGFVVDHSNQVEHQLQNEVRPYFGKVGVNSTTIGDHPDFVMLAGTDDVQNHHICSLFLDIRNSTALSFRYPLKDVVWIKNSILRAASEIVRSMDGHVHRFMGDALLAFFGDKRNSSENSIINAINCCSVLETYMVNTFIPVLIEEGFEARDLGFRIGLDYGNNEQVLWASYGFSEVCEVTATSFYVDVASKLQSMARKNNAMFGDNIINAIDFPSEFTKKRRVRRNGVFEDVDTLNKTYTDREGNVLKYKIRELNVRSYRDLLPLDHTARASLPGSLLTSHENITFKCYVTNGDRKEEYKSVSKALPKNTEIVFKLNIGRGVYEGASFPLTAKFEKRNYGVQAQLDEQAGMFPKGDESISMQSELGRGLFFVGKTIDIPESTKYRGLHTMQAVVFDSKGTQIYKNIIGIYIV